MESIENKIILNKGVYNFLKTVVSLYEYNLYNINGDFINIKKYDKSLKNIIIPIGSFSILEYLPYKINHKENKITKNINFNFTLRNEQQTVINLVKKKVIELENKNIPPYINLSLDCAFGKTIIGFKLISLYKLKTIIIVPRISLVHQWYDHLKSSNLKILTSCYGSSKLLDKQINFESIDILIIPDKHLSNNDLIKKIHDKFSLIIIDESHTYNMQNNISISRFLAFYSFNMCFGLSGSSRNENSLYLGYDLKYKKNEFTDNIYEEISVSYENNNILKIELKKEIYINHKICIDNNNLNIKFHNDDESLFINIVYLKPINIINKKVKILKDNIIKYIYIKLDSSLKYNDIKISKKDCKLVKELYVVTDRNFEDVLFGSTYNSNMITKDIYILNQQFNKLDKKKDSKSYIYKNSVASKLLSLDESRNNLIINHIKDIYKDSTRCLILTELRVSMNQIYDQLVKENLQNIYIGDVKKNIIDVYNEVKKLNDKYILVSTVSASYQGINIENLNTLVIINTMSDEKKIKQSYGRILRNNNITTRTIYIYNETSISNQFRNYLINKNDKFIEVAKNDDWIIKEYLM